MRDKTNYGSRRTLLFLIVLICGLSASALTLADPYIPLSTTPLGIVREASLFASFTSPAPSTALPGAVIAVVATDKRNYKAGETVQISGSGFAANAPVSLQVTHIGGAAEFGGGHEPFIATADSLGNISAAWQMGRDAAGNKFTLSADGAASYNFFRGAHIWVDKFDYQPGQTAIISGEGFNPGETVTLLVLHSNGRNSGSGHTPFEATADSEGKVGATWYVHPDDSLDAIFRLTAIGGTSGLRASSSFTDALVFVKDDAGPDDEPGQKDLNFLSTDDSGANLAVLWGWDDTEWSGNNTGDACALFDNDGNGFVEFALCGTVAVDITDPMLLRRYSCNDTRTDRCAGPTLLSAPTSTGSASVVPNSDPFRAGQTPAHGSGNVCDDDGNCETDDTVANLSVVFSEVGGATTEMINVCSYPSQEPNSDPSDCVITPDQPRLKLVKAVTNDNGGNAVANDWDLSATGSSGSFTELTPAAADATFRTVTAGVQYTLSETGPTGYSASSFSCSVNGGNAVSGNTITLDFEEVAVCTITNNDIAPTITLTKVVINDSGGTAQPNDFALTVGGNAVLSGVSNQVNANTALAINETVVTGYSFVSITGDAKCPAALGGTVTLDEGENVSCTITNNDQPAKLIIIKSVVNDNGGNAVAGDFSGTITGTATFAGGNTWTGTVAPGQEKNMTAAGTYSVSENAFTGYAVSYSADCSGSIALGQTKTCTVTNNDIAPQLKLIKYVVNDDNGNAVVADFPLFINGNAVTSGVFNTLSANTQYTASETTLTGYTPSVWGGDCASDGTITLNEGDSKTCTITNDDVPPTLKLVKTVTNDNGGTATPDDFTLFAAASAPTATRNFSNAGSLGTFQTVFANVGYVLSESSSVTGYTAGSWSCTGGSLVGSTVTLNEGETNITCTINNNDDAARLIVIKHVVNDNGGTATAANFTLDSGGNNDSPDNFAGAESPGTNVTLDAGAYNVTESGPAGYAASFSADCSGTIANGQTKTCTVTNDDISPTLRVIKYLVPTTDTGLFNLRIDGATAGTGANVGNEGTTGFVPVNAGNHTVSETAGTGTSLSDYVTVIGGDCAANGTVSLALAQNKTCTITNTRKGEAAVTKTVNGLTPASNQTFTFELRQGASTLSDGTILETKNTDAAGLIDFTTKLIPGDTYQICEWVFPAWNTNLAGDGPLFVPNSIIPPALPNPNVVNLVVCVNFSVTAGQTRTFTVDNTPPPGGRALTIGFWKNWASCANSNGRQRPFLDWALGIATAVTLDPPDGLVVSAQDAGLVGWPNYSANYFLVLKGNPASTEESIYVAPGCTGAVNLLNKSTVTPSKKKYASDPLFNMTAQLVAAELNRFMGSGINGATIMNIDAAVRLNGKYSFNGNGYTGTLSAADVAKANCLAKELDNYNNNLVTSACP